MATIEAQFDDFDSPSRKVLGVEVHHYGKGRGKAAWSNEGAYRHEPVEVRPASFNLALAHARIVFANNAAVQRQPMQRQGQVNSAHLALVPAGFDRPFKRTRFPNGRRYAVGLTLDCSGSTGYGRNLFIRQIGLGMATLFDRLPGIDFCLYGHTATYANPNAGYSAMAYQVDMHQVKDWGQPWGTKQEAALQALHSASDNLDGHTLEFMRKQVEGRRASDRIIFYLTDGEMPAANQVEETEVLIRELAICKKQGIKVIGIGVETDSPTQYGLDTIRVDDPTDLKHLIKEVGKRLS